MRWWANCYGLEALRRLGESVCAIVGLQMKLSARPVFVNPTGTNVALFLRLSRSRMRRLH